MLSRTGYTRRHSPHFRLSPVSFSTSGFLQTGQTSMSRRSWGIMARILRQIENRWSRIWMRSLSRLVRM
jgi:hypothetical protein